MQVKTVYKTHKRFKHKKFITVSWNYEAHVFSHLGLTEIFLKIPTNKMRRGFQ